MRKTQGAFAFLPELTEDQIRRQIDYCVSNGWGIAIEYAEEVPARNTPWSTWGRPVVAVTDPAVVMAEIRACRAARPRGYIRVSAVDSRDGVEAVPLSFIINRPREDFGFRAERTDTQGRPPMRYRGQPIGQERRFAGLRG